MKRLIASIFVCALVLGAVPMNVMAGDVWLQRPPAPQGANSAQVAINGVGVDFTSQGPVVADGIALMPARRVFEHLNFDVSWDEPTRRVTFLREDYTLVITIDSNVFTVNGEPHELEVPAQIIGDHTMLPMHVLFESIGYTVSWNMHTRTAYISTGAVDDHIFIRELNENVEVFDIEFDGDYVVIGETRVGVNEVYVFLEGMFLTNADIAPLVYLENVQWLYLYGNQISDLTPLAGLTTLIFLDAGSNQVSDISPLAGLVNLEELWLDNNRISDITPLSGLTNLWFLDLTGNPVTDWSPVDHVAQMPGHYSNATTIIESDYIVIRGQRFSVEETELVLNFMDLTDADITPLRYMTNLRYLELEANQITDLSPLADLAYLKVLSLNHNQISDLSPLAGLVGLEILWLGDNQISDVSPLAGLTNLTELWLMANQISDVSPLASLEHITLLILADNPIRDWSPIQHLPGVIGEF